MIVLPSSITASDKSKVPTMYPPQYCSLLFVHISNNSFPLTKLGDAQADPLLSTREKANLKSLFINFGSFCCHEKFEFSGAQSLNPNLILAQFEQCCVRSKEYNPTFLKWFAVSRRSRRIGREDQAFSQNGVRSRGDTQSSV